MTHSPTPWTLGRFDLSDDITDITGKIVLSCDPDKDVSPSDLVFIVRAVNARDDLVAAATIGFHYAAKAGAIHDAAVIKAALAKAGAA